MHMHMHMHMRHSRCCCAPGMPCPLHPHCSSSVYAMPTHLRTPAPWTHCRPSASQVVEALMDLAANFSKTAPAAADAAAARDRAAPVEA